MSLGSSRGTNHLLLHLLPLPLSAPLKKLESGLTLRKSVWLHTLPLQWCPRHHPILPNSCLTPTFRASPSSSPLGHLPATPCPVPRQAEGSRPCQLKAPVTLSCSSFPALFCFLAVATSPAPCSGGRGASTLQSRGLSGLQWPGVFSRWELGCGPASLGPRFQWGSCLLAGDPWGLLIPLSLSVPICEVGLWRSMGQGWGMCPQAPASCGVRAEGQDGCQLAARRRP